MTVSNSTFTGNSGGAIDFAEHHGDLTVSGSTFTDNNGTAITFATVDGAIHVLGSTFIGNHGSDGGAINFRNLFRGNSVSASTFVGNSADGYGGAIFEAYSVGGTSTVSDSTFTGNSAGAAGSSGFGGAIATGWMGNYAPIDLASDTIDENAAANVPGSSGSGVWTQGPEAPVTANGTIVSGNTGTPNCNAPVVSSSDSLEGPSASDTSCGFDLPSADPMLGPLADNGGLTQTQALAPGSPALYRIPQASCPTTTDQRGFPRPAAGQNMCDVGAFELQTPPQIDAQISGEAYTTVTKKLTTPTAGDLLVAFVSTDSSSAAGNTASVSGGGLSWTLAGRQNRALGDSEVWTARATGAFTRTPITATAVAQPGYDVALTVIAFKNTTGIGHTSAFHSPSGAPTGTITTSQENAWVFAAGNDWARSVRRTPGPGQTIQQQTFDSVGDTYWVQSTTASTLTARTPVTINDTSPAKDPYNLVLVEIL